MPTRPALLAYAACGGLLVIVWLLAFYGWRQETYRSDGVSAGRVRTLLTLVSAHSGEECYLKAWGRTYRGVRGVQPFYLEVPALDSILFVTVGHSGRATFHIVRRCGGREVRVDGGRAEFGGHIGSHRTAG